MTLQQRKRPLTVMISMWLEILRHLLLLFGKKFMFTLKHKSSHSICHLSVKAACACRAAAGSTACNALRKHKPLRVYLRTALGLTPVSMEMLGLDCLFLMAWGLSMII